MMIWLKIYKMKNIVLEILLRENIFLPHRRHLYQYLVNEKHWPHLVVSAIYAVSQGIISVVLVLLIIILVWLLIVGVLILEEIIYNP